jgi:hypothetical protein
MLTVKNRLNVENSHNLVTLAPIHGLLFYIHILDTQDTTLDFYVTVKAVETVTSMLRTRVILKKCMYVNRSLQTKSVGSCSTNAEKCIHIQ